MNWTPTEAPRLDQSPCSVVSSSRLRRGETSSHLGRLRCLFGWALLSVYVSLSSPFGAQIAAALGSLDRDHRLILQAGDGGIRVVLHHDHYSAAHHHGLAARTLALFAKPASATDPDHVLQFSTTTSLARGSQSFATAPETLKQNALPNVEVIACSRRDNFFASVPMHAPPVGGGLLACLHSTVLLI